MSSKIISFSDKKRKTKVDNLIEDAAAIEAEYAKENKKIGYLVSHLVQVTFPHKDPGHQDKWLRQNGALSLIIQAGSYPGKNQIICSHGIPYGPKPRLIMTYICSEAVRTKTREVFLGENLSHFMAKLGLGVNGGRGGTIPVVKEQMKRLLTAKITIFNKKKLTDGIFDFEKDFKITRERTYWTPYSDDYKNSWSASIILDESIYEEIIENPVPLHLDVLAALKGSSMDLDIYSWLTYRMSYLKERTEIPWQLLALQFGSEYSQLRDFKRKFLKRLNIVLGFYQAKVNEGKRGLILIPSNTHIAKN